MSNTGDPDLRVGTPAIDYTSRDYQSIRSDLMNSIPSFLPQWTSTSPSDLGIVLIELFAFAGDIINYYIDRIGNESFLATAQQRSSVLNLAYLIDYAPRGSAAATAVLTMTVQANSQPFTLAKGTQFTTLGSNTNPAVTFELTASHSVAANLLSTPIAISTTLGVPLTVAQGVTVYNEAVGTSTGAADQTFTLYNTSVIDGSVVTMVEEGLGPKPWTEVRHLTDAGPYDAVYMLATDANGVVYVSFGDNSNGRIPNPHGVISATYRIGGGIVGNVGANQIVVDLSNSGQLLSVMNQFSAAGGSDPETIAQIQTNAPKSLTAAGRCVSLQDYASVALDIPGVSKASATAAVPTSVQLYVHPGGGPYKVADLASLVVGLAPQITWGGAGPVSNTGVSGYLDSRKMAAATVTVLPPTTGGATGYVQIVLGITATALPQYSNLQVTQDVLGAIDTLLAFGSMTFGQRITVSSVYHAVQGLAGVDYCSITALHRLDDLVTVVGDIVTGPSEIVSVLNPDTSVTGITVISLGGL